MFLSKLDWLVQDLLLVTHSRFNFTPPPPKPWKDPCTPQYINSLIFVQIETEFKSQLISTVPDYNPKKTTNRITGWIFISVRDNASHSKQQLRPFPITKNRRTNPQIAQTLCESPEFATYIDGQRHSLYSYYRCLVPCLTSLV